MKITRPVLPRVGLLFSNLVASATGSNNVVSVAAGAVTLDNGRNGKTFFAVNATAATSVSGAGGIDTGSVAANTWYAVWIIGQESGTAAILLSLSATSPTMPVGYTYKGRIGWIRTDAGNNPLSFKQKGRRVDYLVTASGNVTTQPVINSGSVGNISGPAWVACSLATLVPSTAAAVLVAMSNTSSTSQMVAANANYSTYTGANPGYVASGIGTLQAEIVLQSTDVYWASNNATCKLLCMGWSDNL